MSLTALFLILQALAIIMLAVAVLLINRRVCSLEHPKLISLEHLKRSNELQLFAESLRRPSAFEQTLEKFRKDWYMQHFDND